MSKRPSRSNSLGNSARPSSRLDPTLPPEAQPSESGLLGPLEVKAIADVLGIRPTKVLGQNFVHDAGTVRRIVRAAEVTAADSVLEVGPGLGSLTLALLETGATVSAVEIDPPLVRALPETVRARMPEASDRFRVTLRDAMTITDLDDLVPNSTVVNAAGTDSEVEDNDNGGSKGGVAASEDAVHNWPAPTKLVANLPYNVAVPVILTLLENLPSLTDVLVMVQAEVADRLAAEPGSRTYGVPSVKAAWYGKARRAGTIGRSVFWPVPNVDSALVRIQRTVQPRGSEELRVATFEICDVAFGQRRKTLRSALKNWAGGADLAEKLLAAAQIDPQLRGEALGIDEFVALGQAVLDLKAEGQLTERTGRYA